MAIDFDDHQDALREYLGDGATRYPVADPDPLEQPFLAEVAAQATRLTIPDPITDDLVEALYRRVAVNLAKRSIPVGIVGFGEAGAGVRLGTDDPEIRRLEAPYRDVFVA
jgi:hypothetical protein